MYRCVHVVFLLFSFFLLQFFQSDARDTQGRSLLCLVDVPMILGRLNAVFGLQLPRSVLEANAEEVLPTQVGAPDARTKHLHLVHYARGVAHSITATLVSNDMSGVCFFCFDRLCCSRA